MKKFVLASIAAAAAASFSGSVLAAADLTATPPTFDRFASELVTAGTTPLKNTVVTTALGFGVSAGQTRFIRYDFTNAKIGAGGIVAADLVIANASNVIVSQGGGAGGTNVIFQITGAGAGIAQNAPVTLDLANGLVPDTLGQIDVSYRLYDNAGNAIAGTGHLAQTQGKIIEIGSGAVLTATQKTNTADVNASPIYTQFTAASPVEIGTVSLGTNGALDPNGATATLGQFLGTGSAITLTGDDLTAADAAGLFLGGVNTCAAVGTAGTSRTATGVSFVLTGAQLTGGLTNTSLCFGVANTNTTRIAAQSFTAGVTAVAVPPLAAPVIPSVAAGTFDRNGLILKAAFAETTTAAGIASAAHLTNTSNVAVPFTVNCVLNNGSVAGTPGSLPANTAQRFGLSAGLGCPATGLLRGVEIIFETTRGNVIGSIVRQNTTTGQASFDGMIGNQ
ncbi:MAG TPA: hypothetical protein PKB14_06260 [Rubrivivax sp.]|nr:hypothetical protein [Rubrivivax sp.]